MSISVCALDGCVARFEYLHGKLYCSRQHKQRAKERRKRTPEWKQAQRDRAAQRAYRNSPEGRQRLLETLAKRYREDPIVRERQRKHNLEKKFGLSLRAYQLLFDEQQGLCALCGLPETCTGKLGQPKLLAVDHDHTTGQLRELLCRRCNVVLGMFQDSPELFKRAIVYLNKHTR